MDRQARLRRVRKLEQASTVDLELRTSDTLAEPQAMPLSSIKQPHQEFAPKDQIQQYGQFASRYIPAELIQEGLEFSRQVQNSDLPADLYFPLCWPRDMQEVLWNPSTHQWLFNQTEQICTDSDKVKHLLAQTGNLPDWNNLKGQVLTVLVKALSLAIMDAWPDDELLVG